MTTMKVLVTIKGEDDYEARLFTQWLMHRVGRMGEQWQTEITTEVVNDGGTRRREEMGG